MMVAAFVPMPTVILVTVILAWTSTNAKMDHMTDLIMLTALIPMANLNEILKRI